MTESAIANLERFLHRRGVKSLFIDSNEFKGVHYIVQGKEVIIDAGSCGTFNFAVKNWDYLKNEIEQILEIYCGYKGAE